MYKFNPYRCNVEQPDTLKLGKMRYSEEKMQVEAKKYVQSILEAASLENRERDHHTELSA